MIEWRPVNEARSGLELMRSWLTDSAEEFDRISAAYECLYDAAREYESYISHLERRLAELRGDIAPDPPVPVGELAGRLVGVLTEIEREYGARVVHDALRSLSPGCCGMDHLGGLRGD